MPRNDAVLVHSHSFLIADISQRDSDGSVQKIIGLSKVSAELECPECRPKSPRSFLSLAGKAHIQSQLPCGLSQE